jgi:hypothetical protein
MGMDENFDRLSNSLTEDRRKLGLAFAAVENRLEKRGHDVLRGRDPECGAEQGT